MEVGGPAKRDFICGQCTAGQANVITTGDQLETDSGPTLAGVLILLDVNDRNVPQGSVVRAPPGTATVDPGYRQVVISPWLGFSPLSRE